MTDKEKVLKLFEELGIGVTDVTDKQITLNEGDLGVGGYHGFYADFNFDKNGKFTEIGIFE